MPSLFVAVHPGYRLQSYCSCNLSHPDHRDKQAWLLKENLTKLVGKRETAVIHNHSQHPRIHNYQ
eukprot:scaffold22574_cov125-Cylindrotheca_fusiformis.AAC.18